MMGIYTVDEDIEGRKRHENSHNVYKDEGMDYTKLPIECSFFLFSSMDFYIHYIT